MDRKRRRLFLKMQKDILSKYDQTTRTNQIVLTHDDFIEGRLDGSAFIRLKEESWSIPYAEQIEVVVPKECEIIYSHDVQKYIYRELHKVKQEKMKLTLQCILLLVIGAIILATESFIPGIKRIYWTFDIVIILAWVFAWLGVQLWILDRRDLSHKRFTLLQLAAAKITSN